MFGMMFGFLALILFACFITAVIVIGRKAGQLVHVRGDTELLKAKIQRQKLQHILAVEGHQQQLQVLALSAGPSTEESEEVKVKSKDILPPHVRSKEWYMEQKLQKQAVDAEVSLPFIDS